MIYIFDLDDTLYDERQYVESGFRAVARFAEQKWGLNQDESWQSMLAILDKEGRGAVFNRWLAPFALDTKTNIKRCLSAYRTHQPDLSMPAAHLELLHRLPKPLYLVTDGNKVVQHNKVKALGIEALFKRVFITHRFGVQHAKPSTHCFELIKQAEGCEWQDMVYIGDNPAKDFVNLNKLGMQTVRVLTGVHRKVDAAPGYEAHYRISCLDAFSDFRF
ncbi:HAD family hydrolase [Salinimonas marina]|uniref:HAD family hydrolase n=1 Tax=Salinimonas marina TaxID=2785918 RepID=A0A7S9HC97_9ALTE|nr:HAD family hydrolase [Salinimonas marina]QPG04955.1 HAD family hydrolase [Salinimonas marina]